MHFFCNFELLLNKLVPQPICSFYPFDVLVDVLVILLSITFFNPSLKCEGMTLS